MNKFFDKYYSLFVLPLLVLIISFIKMKLTSDWAAIAFAVWFIVAIGAILLGGLFLLINHFFLKLPFNWWKNLLVSIGLLFLSTGLLILLIRISQ